ncbi:hypothetical protein DKM44_00240 [Deinococcus irradiatisoli]|uniref:Uncharacterized protein n=1 Tax=Deinococcus irradiatisoli TaxID=2202254 RepID=A0A2Z3JCT6_9DEIO|nr:hypothetical protein [Deinococcus irradiatisoli]AWN21856.1 hypothetical protein DKM44_00240 [Deinococcus irradiatisoli]
MNYAASLATVVVLAFFFPLLVRLASVYGVSRSLSASTLAVVLTFVTATYLIRFQVTRFRQSTTKLDAARAQVAQHPDQARAYFVDDEHLATMLLRLGRRREAADVVDRYARLAGAREVEITALREALAKAERRQRGEG